MGIDRGKITKKKMRKKNKELKSTGHATEIVEIKELREKKNSHIHAHKYICLSKLTISVKGICCNSLKNNCCKSVNNE